MMYDSYDKFLNLRAVERRLLSRFRRPHWLALHTAVFVTIMCGIWYFGLPYLLWQLRENYIPPVLAGFVWSFILAGHAFWTYRRSAAAAVRREEAVAAEMQQLSRGTASELEQQSLIDIHQRLEDRLERQGQAVVALTVFALVNILIWFVTLLNIGSSFAFQIAWPIALIVVGGINAFSYWLQQRRNSVDTWFSRFPLRHLAAYFFGALALGLMGMLRMVNSRDVDTVVQLWTWLLLVHVAWGVIAQPLWQRLNRWLNKPAKRKHSEELLLDDDGELLMLADDELDAPPIHLVGEK
jgi:hypothetical protein